MSSTNNTKKRITRIITGTYVFLEVGLSPIGDKLLVSQFNKQLKLRNKIIPWDHIFSKHYSLDLSDMHLKHGQFEEKELDPKKKRRKYSF